MDINKTLLTPEQLEDQIQTIIEFLSAVHPSLLRKKGFRPSVELRPIARRNQSYLFSKSLNLWDLSEESIKRLREFLERHNGQANCLYYSVFNYDQNQKTMTKKGEMAKQGKITTEGAIATEEIALDFDGIEFDGYAKLVDAFESLGIYALWVFTGHGYHAHILLDEELEDKKLLRRFVYKFRSKGFDCDPSCVDPARIMRLPGTFNNKCFSDETYAAEQSNPPFCEIVQSTAQRYSLKSIMEKLDTLPTVNEEDEAASKELEQTAEAAVSSKKAQTETLTDSIELTKVEYPWLAPFELPTAVSKMLAYTPHGYRNKVLGFLIKFLKDQYKLGKTAIMETLLLWSKEACDPAYDPEDFKSDFSRLYYHYNGLKYDSALARQFGPIDFQALILLRKKDIYVPHKFFRDFEKLGSGEVRLYLAIKMLEHMETDTTQEQLAQFLGISTRKLRPTLQSLIKSGHCYIKKGNSRNGIPNTYHTNRINSSHDGYMVFGYNDLNTYVKELCEQGERTRSNVDLKLYLFMRWKFYSGEIYMTQTNLGKHLGTVQTTIHHSVYRLQDRHFLKVKKIRVSALQEACEYTLLR